MKKYSPTAESKLDRIVKNTEMIINYSGPSDNLKSEYNSIKDDWNTLKDDLQEKWIDIKFTGNDFEYNGYFNKFSEIGKTNMQKIKGICKDVLAEIAADEKENDFKKDVETNKKLKLKTEHWLAIIGLLIAGFSVLIASIYSDTNQKLEIRYDQGKQDVRNELTNTLNAQQNTIQNLLDSLEKIKLRNEELEKCIKLKKTCK